MVQLRDLRDPVAKPLEEMLKVAFQSGTGWHRPAWGTTASSSAQSRRRLTQMWITGGAR